MIEFDHEQTISTESIVTKKIPKLMSPPVLQKERC